MKEEPEETNQAARAAALLEEILDHAAEINADGLEFEWTEEGLEIIKFSGASGVGGLIEDAELAGPLMRLIARRARLGYKDKVRCRWKIGGRQRGLTVEQYDSFGETCYRLHFDR